MEQACIYERIRDQEGFRGSYGAVKDYAHPISQDQDYVWEYAYDHLISLGRKRAIDFLFYLSRADPPVISPVRAEQLFLEASQIIIPSPKPDNREGAKRAAFEWLRMLLQKEISSEELHREIGDLQL